MRLFPGSITTLLLLVAVSSAHGEVCFEQQDTPTTAACLAHADSIAGDAKALRSLGRQLEIADRYEQAAELYRHVLPLHLNDRALQKGLIRVRRELRDRAILDGFDRDAGLLDVTPCFTLRWNAAVTACRDEFASDRKNWELAERYGDALRSVGRPAAALDAYRDSLRLYPANAGLRKKHDVLLDLVDLEKAELTSEQLPEMMSSAALPEPREDIVVATKTLSDATSAPPAVLHHGRYRAIVFGNQNYQAFEDLESPIADANAISNVLREQYGFDVSTVIDASRYEIFEVLADLRRNSSKYENVLIYYAGHGYLDTVTKRGYWLPTDAEADNPANWISTSDITNLVAGLESKHALVIADSCFSGALTRVATAATFESRNALLERLASQRSRMILTSGGLEPVLDGGNPFSRHSVFADALLAALRRNDTVIEAGRLFVQVRDSVALASDQTPQYAPLRSAGHAGGDFIFARHPGARDR
ncbi:MAG: caspase family protein [Woeseiaceae bacterium]